MLTGPMMQMLGGMLKNYIENLPPEEKARVSQTIGFVATLDERLTRIEATLASIQEAINQDKEADHGERRQIEFDGDDNRNK